MTVEPNIVAKVQSLEALCSRSGTPCASGLVDIINRLRDENSYLREQVGRTPTLTRGNDGLMHTDDCRYHDADGCASQPRMDFSYNPWVERP